MTIGVLLTNLGTPAAPTPSAVRRYLAEFLSDPRVVEIPRWLWWWVLHGIVLRVRPRKTARGYQRIWQNEGSPLLTTTERQASLLQKALSDEASTFKVLPAMRYGQPGILDAIQQFLAIDDLRQLIVLPLYPQYSATTTASTFDAVAKALRQVRRLPELRVINGYATHRCYIQALAASVEQHWQTHGRQQKLICSFHGLPQRNVNLGDPYYQQCQETAASLASELNIQGDDYLVTFQSRFGRAPWLQPYTDKTLQHLPERGINDVDILCPGFAADCLETLEEVAITNRNIFLAAGGKRFHYIPALNTQAQHIEMMKQLVRQQVVHE